MSPKAPVSAWWKAQELLARRAHGTQELINKLKLRDFPPDEIDAAIRRLLEKGILDDEAFAERLTEELFFRRGYGFYAVLQRLRQKGLDFDLCQRVVKKFFAEIDNDEMSVIILRLIERRRVSRDEVVRMLKRISRQRSLTRRRKLDYIVRQLNKGPPRG
jgi:regulatory protein